MINKSRPESEINLPSREECLEMIDDPEYNLPEDRKKHILKVNEIACKLGKILKKAGIKIDINILDRASLLHDIKKATSKDHEKDAAALIRQSGWSEKLAGVVELHPTHMLPQALKSNWEAKVLNYADRRVWPGNKIRSLKEWLDEKDNSDRQSLYEQYRQLEKDISSKIGKEELEKIFTPE